MLLYERKKFFRWTREAILGISALLIPIIAGVGVFKANTQKKENYVSVWKETDTSQKK